MRKKLLKFLAATVLFGSAVPNFMSASDDFTRVQTLTFDSTLTRQGVWKFPDKSKKYRKIIMNYTLKCDPKTAQDKYNCGEWDYLTYNVIHHNTGRDTAYTKTQRKFMLGASTADELKYITYDEVAAPVGASGTGERIINGKKITASDGEVLRNPFSGSAPISVGSNPFRYQIILTKAELKEYDMAKLLFGRLRLKFADAAGATLKNLQIKMKNTPAATLADWQSEMTTVFDGDYLVPESETATIDLFEDFETKTVNSFVVEISADGFTSPDAKLLGAENATGVLAANDNISFLKFDGTNDYVYSDNTALLKNTKNFSMEAWVRMDSWKAWSKIMGIGDQLHFETGDVEGDLYFMIRNGMNSYGKISDAITLGEWVHIAVTYDGTQTENTEKLKMFVNGKPATVQYTGILPDYTAGGDEPFTVSSIEWSSACVDAGIFDVRVWDKTLSEQEIADWSKKFVTADHPSYTDLALNYTFQNDEDIIIKDSSPKHNDGKMFGFPGKCKINSANNPIVSAQQSIPDITFIAGTFTREDNIVTQSFNTVCHPTSLAEFEVIDHKPVIKSVQKVWSDGDLPVYREDGTIVKNKTARIDGDLITINNEIITYQTASEPLLEEIEIGRFITPYGIGLDLGPDGFTWKYDVTDYEPYLHGDVNFSAGNLQELIDVSFDFYEGIPPRDVVKMTEIWGNYKSLLYKDLSSDDVLSEVTMQKQPETRQMKLKTRLTGHGHQSNDGSYPHCCEWKDNTHSILTESNQYDWHIWQETDCALNPVFPQGGTWPGSREGWCPGDVVKDFDFELPEYAETDYAMFDYEITKVPSSNQGMGTGNYIVAMQVFEYGASNHEIDAEVVDVISPNNFPLYSRTNPICSGPKIIIRNNGTSELTSLRFDYGVSGKTTETYTWNGTLGTNLKDTIDLPITEDFWLGAAERNFTVKISEPNNSTDQYSANDEMTTSFELPDIYEKGCVLMLSAPQKYSETIHMTVKDMQGNVVINRSSINNNASYRDTLNLPNGCYTMEIVSDEQIGISYWAVSEMGSGALKILKPDGSFAKVFEPDFGHSLRYSFSIGGLTSVKDMQEENLLRLYPNPATREINFRLDDNVGTAECELYDMTGKMLDSRKFELNNSNLGKFDTSNLPAGSYFIRIITDKYDIKKNFIKK